MRGADLVQDRTKNRSLTLKSRGAPNIRNGVSAQFVFEFCGVTTF